MTATRTTSPTPIPVIRQARPGEGTVIAAILTPVYPGRPDLLRPLSRAIDDGATASVIEEELNCLVLLAQDGDGTPIAALTAMPWSARTPIDPRPAVAAQARRAVVVVEGLAVTPAARGRRLGHRLLDRAAEHLTFTGCRLMIADFDPGQVHLDRYYRTAGFRIHAHALPLSIRLNGWSLQRRPRVDTTGQLLTTAWRPLNAGAEEDH